MGEREYNKYPYYNRGQEPYNPYNQEQVEGSNFYSPTDEDDKISNVGRSTRFSYRNPQTSDIKRFQVRRDTIKDRDSESNYSSLYNSKKLTDQNITDSFYKSPRLDVEPNTNNRTNDDRQKYYQRKDSNQDQGRNRIYRKETNSKRDQKIKDSFYRSSRFDVNSNTNNRTNDDRRKQGSNLYWRKKSNLEQGQDRICKQETLSKTNVENDLGENQRMQQSLKDLKALKITYKMYSNAFDLQRRKEGNNKQQLSDKALDEYERTVQLLEGIGNAYDTMFDSFNNLYLKKNNLKKNIYELGCESDNEKPVTVFLKELMNNYLNMNFKKMKSGKQEKLLKEYIEKSVMPVLQVINMAKETMHFILRENGIEVHGDPIFKNRFDNNEGQEEGSTFNVEKYVEDCLSESQSVQEQKENLFQNQKRIQTEIFEDYRKVVSSYAGHEPYLMTIVEKKMNELLERWNIDELMEEEGYYKALTTIRSITTQLEDPNWSRGCIPEELEKLILEIGNWVDSLLVPEKKRSESEIQDYSEEGEICGEEIRKKLQGHQKLLNKYNELFSEFNKTLNSRQSLRNMPSYSLQRQLSVRGSNINLEVLNKAKTHESRVLSFNNLSDKLNVELERLKAAKTDLEISQTEEKILLFFTNIFDLLKAMQILSEQIK